MRRLRMVTDWISAVGGIVTRDIDGGEKERRMNISPGISVITVADIVITMEKVS